MANADVFLIRLYQDQITQAGFEFLTAHNGMEATRIIENEHPDIILLDLILPQMSGYGFLRELKHHLELAEIPVVVLSAVGDEEVVRECVDLGAVGYLRKTCEADELVSMVSEYSGKNRCESFIE